jgi:uncharacterized protein (DUF1330 family)
MSAYVISEVEVRDEAAAAKYAALAADSIAAHGGRYLVRIAKPIVAEGPFAPERRVVVVAFPAMDQTFAWYRSPEYAKARAYRESALERTLLFVDGVRADRSIIDPTG